jgi:transposase
MPRPRIVMRKIREVLRLRLGERMTLRTVAAVTGLPYTTVADHIARAVRCGLGWPLPDGMDDIELEKQLFAREPSPPKETRPVPDWGWVRKQLSRVGVTLMLLWVEFKELHPDTYEYTQFVRYYRQWEQRCDLVMRQEHRAGQKLFVDFAGKKAIKIRNPATGVVKLAELFVAVMGASNYIYAEAMPSQELPFWVQGHINCFEYMGGCPELSVCDNLWSAVTKSHRYEPDINATFEEMGAHYRVAILPARARKPRDKAKVESGVLVAERWLLARLRDRIFDSYAEANQAIRELLVWINERPFKKLPGSRKSWFEEIDKPALRPLPERRYELGHWRIGLKVGPDYHLDIERHFYSVPSSLVRQYCDARYTATTVEIFHKHRRVASHIRSYKVGKHTTLKEHMPSSHRRHAEWTPGRLLNWGRRSGPNTAALMDAIMNSRPHPEQGFRSCLGLMRLGRQYGAERLEAACQRALAIHSHSYHTVNSILRNRLDRQPLPSAAPAYPPRQHENVRGATYYR